MDELPELRSDTDVDAMMSRLRAKLGPASAAAGDTATPLPADVSIGDLVALQQQLVSLVTRAMQLIVDTLDDLDSDAADGRGADRERRLSSAAPAPRAAGSSRERPRLAAPAAPRRTAAARRPATKPARRPAR
jgi:hypothetical protein